MLLESVSIEHLFDNKEVLQSLEDVQRDIGRLESDLPEAERTNSGFLVKALFNMREGDYKDALENLKMVKGDTVSKYRLLQVGYARTGDTKKALSYGALAIKNAPNPLPRLRLYQLITMILDAKAAKLGPEDLTRKLIEVRTGFEKLVEDTKIIPVPNDVAQSIFYNFAALNSLLGDCNSVISQLKSAVKAGIKNVIEEIESDPDNDFDNFKRCLRNSKPDWREELRQRLKV